MSSAARADPLPGDLVERARALQPLVREAADEAERERRLPARVAEAMARAGLYRVAAPAAFQGAEADPVTQIRVIEAVSEADGAAGWNLMIGIETFGLLAPRFGRGRELFADPLAIVCSSSASVGRAERVDGGYRVSGQWPFVSGCHNSDYFGGIVAVHEEGAPAGEPPRYALTDREHFEILDTWHVAGLRGSGSHDVRLSDVFVPEADTMLLLPGAAPAAELDSPVTRIPFGSRLAYNKVGVCLGIARAAIDAFVEIATGKVPRFSSAKLRERPHAQRAVARAEASVRGARAFVLEAAGELWEGVLAGREISRRERALLQVACSDAALACADAVDCVAEAAGTSANRLDCPLERHARDVRVIRQHVTVAPHHLEDAGRVLLGLDPQGLMLGLG
ncbi:MAG: acyl-CoA dehydrogenase family protein [Myxococcota bacterium]|nr:acyl-CoA dehydrogenase family protein [Myxococcota bacterium]